MLMNHAPTETLKSKNGNAILAQFKHSLLELLVVSLMMANNKQSIQAKLGCAEP
jgi:hypothetical protein